DHRRPIARHEPEGDDDHGGRPAAAHHQPAPASSARSPRAISRARSTSPGGKEMAPTTGWPPPPWRSHSEAMSWRRDSGRHGFEPMEIFTRSGPRVMPRV